LINLFQSLPNGMALNTTVVKHDYIPDIYVKLVIPTAYYVENQPVEWSIRSLVGVVWEISRAK